MSKSVFIANDSATTQTSGFDIGQTKEASNDNEAGDRSNGNL